MQNPDENPDPEFRKKFFFLKFFFFNCEQFLLNACLSKLNISPKKISFLPEKVCFLHFSYLPASASEPNCIYNLCSKSGQKIGKQFDRAQPCTIFISGKKPDPENPGKNLDIKFFFFWSDFQNGQQKLLFYGKMQIFFGNSDKF